MEPHPLRTTETPGRPWPASLRQCFQVIGPSQPLQISADEIRARSRSVPEPVVFPFRSNHDATWATNVIKDPIPMYVVEFISNPPTPSSSNDTVDDMIHLTPVDDDHRNHVEQSAGEKVERQGFAAHPKDRANDTDMARNGDHGQIAALKLTSVVEPGETGRPCSKRDCNQADEADDELFAMAERFRYSPYSDDAWSMSDMDHSALLEEELFSANSNSAGSWTFLPRHDGSIW